MKKLILMAFLAFGMTANAETIVNNDSEEVDKSLIDLGQGKDENDRWSMHFMVGVNVPTGAPDGMKFAPFRSWELNWTILQYNYTPQDWKTTFSAGVGFNWRVYTLKGHDTYFAKQSDGWITTVNQTIANSYLGGGEYDVLGFKMQDLSSNIHTTSLSFPLLIKQRFHKNFAVSVGAQVNWNFWGRIHNYYEFEDHQIDDYTKKIGQRDLTVDVLGIVDFGKIGIYCKYSPMSVLEKDRGPKFQSLAFGIYL
jgi:hypothetical protein